MRKLLLLCAVWLLALAGCAGLPGHDPLNVTLAGLDSLPGQGMAASAAMLAAAEPALPLRLAHKAAP